MPAPALYVIAIVGTIGAVLAFKEFVYEPHIVPAIDRWKAEYQAARRRRREEELHAAQVEVQMTQTQTRGSRRASNDESSEDDESPSESGKPMDGKFMTGGLLLRRPELNSPQKGGDVELDNFVAREVSEWRNENSQVLRQRKNISEHAMDESIHPIPYSPLSPSRTHVVFDPSAPSTPSTTTSLPHSPVPSPTSSKLRPLEFEKSTLAITNETSIEPHPIPATTPITREELHPTQTIYSSSVLTPVPAPTLSRSPLVPPSASSTLLAQSPFSTQASPGSSLPTSPKPLPPFPHFHAIPSLSQSYPQELDYEHGLELLSPPSSRADSPFSMAEASPNGGLRSLSPFSNVSSSRPESGFSSSASSPFPLRMNLGNQSFDAVSPLQQPQGISSFLSPAPPPSQNPSATNSARSTTYLSFDDDSSDDGVDQTQPRANVGTNARVSAEGALRREDTTSSSPNSPPSTSQLASRTLTPEQIHGLGLTLFPVPPREPKTPGAAGGPLTSTATINSVVAGSRDPSYFRASSGTPLAASTPEPAAVGHPAQNHHHHAHLPSDGELSDLDLMSDFAPSESDFGNESDSGWSFAGGSQVGGSSAAPSPRMRRGQL